MTDCPQNLHEEGFIAPHLCSKIQVSRLSRFKVIAFFIFVAEFVNVTRKKHKDFQRKALRKSQFMSIIGCDVSMEETIASDIA